VLISKQEVRLECVSILILFAEHGQRTTEVQRLQGPDVQPQVLADGVQESLKRQDWHSESRTAEGRAARGGLPGEHRSVVDPHTQVHAEGRHVEVRRFRFRHPAPEHRVQSVRVEGSTPQRQHQAKSCRMAQISVRVLTRARRSFAQIVFR